MTRPRKTGAFLISILAGLSLAAIIAGLVIIGGPQQAREVKHDEALLAELIKSGHFLKCYYAGTKDLPETQAQLRNWHQTEILPKDCRRYNYSIRAPFFKEISYTRLSTRTARLCAIFKHPTPFANRRTDVRPSANTYLSYESSTLAFFGFNKPRATAGEACFEASFSDNGQN